jgi:hypothetical protein
VLLFLENAGTDLESYKFDKTCGWRQALDVLWQVADSLATAEKEAEFEVGSLNSKSTPADMLHSIVIFMKARSSFPNPKRANYKQRSLISACLVQSPPRSRTSSGQRFRKMFSMGKANNGTYTGL